ncbi:MAG TPA: hypothetical protein VFT16_03840 [Candidatus Saccharimonadales bacterium]|nr:hypothetical protein [Candidatus Saccharimonadales bacterium]
MSALAILFLAWVYGYNLLILVSAKAMVNQSRYIGTGVTSITITINLMEGAGVWLLYSLSDKTLPMLIPAVLLWMSELYCIWRAVSYRGKLKDYTKSTMYQVILLAVLGIAGTSVLYFG